jgi:hypothetical protein
MNISLNRFAVFLTGTLLIFLIFLASPILLFFFHDVVNGKVIDVKSYQTSRTRYSSSTQTEFQDVVQYMVGQQEYSFMDSPSGAPSAMGSEVGVIYNTLFPSQAYTVTIDTIMKKRSLYAVILFVPWLAFSTSFIGKDEVVTVQGGKLRLEKRFRA